MQIIEQSSLFKENICQNDVQKEVHFIVKRTPFTVKLALDQDSALTFANAPLECCLFYDSVPMKEVDAPNLKPLEWVARSSACGYFATVEFRINVLTTQHQNNLFVTRIRLSKNGHTLEGLTKPIKSVSKPEQVRRRVSQQAQDPQAEVPVPPNCSSKKRARSEELLESLATIQNLQQYHTDMLRLLVSNQTQVPLLPQPSTSLSPSNSLVPPAPLDLETNLNNLVASFANQPTEDRPAKLRKILRQMPSEQQSLLQDISRIISSSDDTSTQSLAWESLLGPILSQSADSGFEPLESKCDSLSNSFQQWLQQ